LLLALLNSHRQRFGVLHQKRTNLLGADGGVQKIKSVIRAMMRIEKDNIDIDKINEDSNPTEVAKFIADQITNFQEFDEKPEHLNKIMKRLKRMVRTLVTRLFSSKFLVPT
jgi:ribosomal protein S3